MDHSALLHMKPRELALHLRHESRKQSARTVSTHLLEDIELEVLPPTVFDIFLTSVDLPCSLRDVLWQQHSKHIRHAAIRRFGKDLKGVKWEDAWQEVGGTEGLLDLFSYLSVFEVRNLCKAIGCCSGRIAVKNGVERQLRVTELVRCLMSPLYPSSPYKSKDQRPLHSHYARMIPACTPDFIESLFRQQSHPLLESLPKKMLVQHHFGLLRRLVLGAISGEDSTKDDAAQGVLNYISLLLQFAPSVSVTEPRFSTSMSLAMTILERITVDKGACFPQLMFLPELMIPLIRRLQAHRVDPTRVQQIIQLAAKYLRRHEYARAQLSLEKRSLMCYISNYWSHAPALFEGVLVDFIGIHRGGAPRDLSCYQYLIHQVTKSQRYDLLTLVCLHSTNIRTDIKSEAGLRSIPIEKWPIFIFQSLQRDHSLSLLGMLNRLNPEGNFLELRADRTILSQARSPGSNFGDPRLLLAILQPKKKGPVDEAQNSFLETLKSKASKSREQTDRGFFARSAAFHAIASGSLELYDEVVQWTRRFLRDAMTVKTVYSRNSTLTVEGIALLRGIPEDLLLWNTAEVYTRITKANNIMLSLLDSAVTSLREPSYYVPDWYGPLSLFQEVVVSRVKSAGRLKSHFQLSEDEVYDLLWSQTVQMLLRAEEIGLQHESLKFNSPHGPMCFPWGTAHRSKPAFPSFDRFLDDLARSRDALWKQYRPTVDPAVAALEPPWPRGLPIQCLTGFLDVAVDGAYAQTPFLAERAASVVMADPAIVLVDVTIDKETRHAIGQFIDKFEVALAIYVMQAPPGDEQDSRVHAALSHAISRLSQGPFATSLDAIRSTSNARLSETEAEIFWKVQFGRAISQMRISTSKIKVNSDYPVIPTEIDPRETFEWNPTDMIPPNVESRELPVTNLDCMIAAERWLGWDTRHNFQTLVAETQAIISTPIWSSERLEYIGKIPRPVQEGMIVTALLIESSEIEGSDILALPFPSGSNVRYPSLFLDHDFLLSSDALYPPADSVLSRFIDIVPSTLLLDLTASALDALSRAPSGSTKLASTEHTAYRLLMLLSKSDRPDLASNLIIRTVLDRPDASSWHRQLLSRSFLRSLSAGQAQDMVSAFASSIIEALERQLTSSSSQKKLEDPDTSSHRYIKVTTVKLLAQLLDDADFLMPGPCVDILWKLFQTSTHVDIRVTVLDSVLSRLGRCKDVSSNALAERLMSAMEAAIPVLGSLNERKQTQELDWTEAEKTGKLPEVYDDGGMHVFPPMLDVMLRAIASRGISSGRLRTAFIQRIVIPVIEKSREESARWVKMFTLKHSPADQAIHPPSFPVRPRVLENVIKDCSNDVPTYILDLYQRFFLTNISPPAGLVKLNNKINSDIELRNSNEGQYWLSLYGQGAEVSTSVIVSMLTEPWQLSAALVRDRISHVQKLVFEQADALLQAADESFLHWNSFMVMLEPPLAQYESDLDRKTWLQNGKPVLLRIIGRIGALRNPAWQRDRSRQPAVLPPTFHLRLWLLEYPQLKQSSDACASFAQQIVSVLRKTINLGLSRHARLEEIRSALSRCFAEDGIRVARCLGSVELDDPTRKQERLLRVELADGMLWKVQRPQDTSKNGEIWRLIKGMLDAWRDCEDEDMRMRGIRLGKHLRL